MDGSIEVKKMYNIEAIVKKYNNLLYREENNTIKYQFNNFTNEYLSTPQHDELYGDFMKFIDTLDDNDLEFKVKNLEDDNNDKDKKKGCWWCCPCLFKSKKTLCIFVLDFFDNSKQKSENFLSSFLEHAKISAPCSANFINIDLPIPLLHPVITAIFFDSKFCISY